MKKVSVAVLLFLLSLLPAFGQVIKTPSQGKALVYFVRPSGMGAIINFKYFDGEKYLGKFNAGKYLAYECEPGKHIFWAKAENMDFVEAEVEAGKVYVIEAEPMMGFIKASVQLLPLDKTDKRYNKRKKKIVKALSKDESFVYNAAEDKEEDYADMAKRGLEKFAKRKDNGEHYLKLTNDASAEVSEFVKEQ